MALVLTESSTVKCSHQGSVTLRAGQSKLTVGGAHVLVEGDLDGASIAGCSTPLVTPPPPPPSSPCHTVTSASGGVAGKLSVNGKGVLLETIQGTTDGVVSGVTPQTWAVQTAGETKLKAV